MEKPMDIGDSIVNRKRSLLAVALSLWTSTVVASPECAILKIIPNPDGYWLNIVAISGNGRILVGNAFDGSRLTPFRMSTSSLIQRDQLRWELLESLNEDGLAEATYTNWNGTVVVGYSQTDGNPSPEAFRWTAWDGMSGLGVLDEFAEPPSVSKAWAVSPDGDVVTGTSFGCFEGAPECEAPQTGVNSFRWREDAMSPLGNPPELLFIDAVSTSLFGRVVAGRGQIDGGSLEAAIIKNGVLTLIGPLPNGTPNFGRALDISLVGRIVVGQTGAEEGREAFIWKDGELTGLGDLPGGAYSSAAVRVTADGRVVVGVSTAETGPKPFVWTENRGMESLLDVLVDEYGLEEFNDFLLVSPLVNISDNGRVLQGEAIVPEVGTVEWVVFLPHGLDDRVGKGAQCVHEASIGVQASLPVGIEGGRPGGLPFSATVEADETDFVLANPPILD